MLLPDHKTKIVATIGPASESPEMLERLIRAGLNVARLNFSHGDFTGHAERIVRIRAAEKAAGRRVAIMADLPGPKMRVGKIEPEPIQLRPGESLTLTSEDVVGNSQRVAAYTEAHRPPTRLNDLKVLSSQRRPTTAAEAIASVVEHALETVPCAAVFVPTRTGTTARMISRFNPAVWIVPLSQDAVVCQGLAFSYGTCPVQLAEDPENWCDFVRQWLREHRLPGPVAMLVAGPSSRNPDANYRIEFLRVGEKTGRT